MMSLGLETIEFKRIPKEATQAANFLRDHVQGRVKTRGSQIQVEGAKHRELKLLLHKFLRHRGSKDIVCLANLEFSKSSHSTWSNLRRKKLGLRLLHRQQCHTSFPAHLR